MIKTARIVSLLIMLFAVAIFLGGIPGYLRSGSAAYFVGGMMFPVLLGVPLVSALIALGGKKPKVERFAITANKASLFVLAAALIGAIFQTMSFQSVVPWLPGAILLGVCLLLNTLALQRQRQVHAQQGAPADVGANAPPRQS